MTSELKSGAELINNRESAIESLKKISKILEKLEPEVRENNRELHSIVKEDDPQQKETTITNVLRNTFEKTLTLQFDILLCLYQRILGLYVQGKISGTELSLLRANIGGTNAYVGATKASHEHPKDAPDIIGITRKAADLYGKLCYGIKWMPTNFQKNERQFKNGSMSTFDAFVNVMDGEAKELKRDWSSGSRQNSVPEIPVFELVDLLEDKKSLPSKIFPPGRDRGSKNGGRRNVPPRTGIDT